VAKAEYKTRVQAGKHRDEMREEHRRRVLKEIIGGFQILLATRRASS
jgi:hypothetical protein